MIRNGLLNPQTAAPAMACPDPPSHLLPSPLCSFMAQEKQMCNIQDLTAALNILRHIFLKL